MTDRKDFKKGTDAGRHWAIRCSPEERTRFWKNRGDLDHTDSESVFEAIYADDEEDDPDQADWEASHSEFWGTEIYGDPPPVDFVRGFVAGAKAIISKVARDRQVAEKPPEAHQRTSRPRSKQKTRR